MRLSAICAVAFLAPGIAGAQGLDDISRAMGADKIKTIQYSGSGHLYAVGQSIHPQEPWPRFNLKGYTLTANYETASMTLEQSVTQGENPPRGGGRQPVTGVQKRNSGLSGDTGWTWRGKQAGPSRGTASAHHALWTSPHGVIKALQAANAALGTKTVGGKTYRTASFGKKGAFKAVAWFGKDNLLRGVDAWVVNPVFGDMHVATVYSGYKTMDGLKFPTRITSKAEGFPSFDLKVAKVVPNAAADINTPEGLRGGGGRVKTDKVADGLWYVTGGSHHSVVVEMKDHVIVIEGPLGDRRAKAGIKAARELVPGKPIRFVVNTHHHFDHSGGLRAFAAEGVTIVTHNINAPFYKRIYADRHSLRPDALAKSGKRAKFLGVGDRHVMTDGTRSMELHLVKGNLHNAGMLIAYLRAEKIMIVADVYSGRGLRKAPLDPKKVSVFTANLWQNLQRLKLDIETVLPIHGEKVGFEQVRFAAGQP